MPLKYITIISATLILLSGCLDNIKNEIKKAATEAKEEILEENGVSSMSELMDLEAKKILIAQDLIIQAKTNYNIESAFAEEGIDLNGEHENIFTTVMESNYFAKLYKSIVREEKKLLGVGLFKCENYSELKDFSYSLGVKNGREIQSLFQQKLDIREFTEAIFHSLNDSTPKLNLEEGNKATSAFIQNIRTGKTNPEDPQLLKTISYSYGHIKGNYLKSRYLKEINYDQFAYGMNDLLSNNRLRIKAGQINPIIEDHFAILHQEVLEAAKKSSADVVNN